MTQQMAIAICKQAVWTALFVAGPMLLAGLLVGIAVSIFQSVTQIQEMTLTFIPKILAVVTVLILALPWIMNMLIAFTNDVFGMFSIIH
jgi:flagellar biosynthetic protein FliQ